LRAIVDTNVLLRFSNPNEPQHTRIVEAVNTLLRSGHDLGHTPQARRELWSVATRPKEVNGLGADPVEANLMLQTVDASITLWDDVAGIAAEWQRLVVSLGIKGLQVHDANHAAAAIVHSATHVLTLDKRDFERYRRFGLVPITPDEV